MLFLKIMREALQVEGISRKWQRRMGGGWQVALPAASPAAARRCLSIGGAGLAG